jgi:tetratricopeptide (TPR) repeat protein
MSSRRSLKVAEGLNFSSNEFNSPDRAMTGRADLAQAQALLGAGRFAEAEALCHAVLARNTGHAGAWLLLGVIALQTGNLLYAEATVRRSLSLRPESADAVAALAAVLKRSGRPAEAEASLRAVGPMQGPRAATAQVELAELQRERGALAEAEATLRQALAADGFSAEAWHALGLLRQAQGEMAAAEASFKRALELEPNFVAAWINLGSLKAGLEKFDEAIPLYDRALALAPDHAAAHWNRALALLTLGDYPAAWRDYDWRWRIPELVQSAEVKVLARRWRGEPVAGKTVLLHSEQGIGDTIQLARYAPLAARQGARVILAVQPVLVSLLAQLPNLERVMSVAEPLPPFDLQASLPDLPGLFGTSLASIPDARGYLRPDPARAERWSARFRAESRRKVGLIWAGNPRHRDDRYRSITLAMLEPLLGRDDVAWFSLQVGERAKDLAAVSQAPVIDLSGDLSDFSETAAALSQLDLLISVDTAAAHLAGALGCPTWLLIARQADWRWMRDRADSPWYTSLRLFRQQRQGDWAPVIAGVVAAFTQLPQ